MKRIVDLDLSTVPQYFPTQDAICKFFGVTIQTVNAGWSNAEGWPNKTKQGYRAVAVLEVIKKKQITLRGKFSGSELSDEERRKKIELLQIKIDNLNDKLIPMDDHVAECLSLLRIMKEGMLTYDKNMQAIGLPAKYAVKMRDLGKDTLRTIQVQIKRLGGEEVESLELFKEDK